MKILFICKYNRFRSQIAENYFRKINKNKSIKFSSAGIIVGKPIPSSVKQVARKLGFEIKGKPKGIQETLLDGLDLLIIIADNVPESLFETRVKRLIKWNVPDTSAGDLCDIERISRVIMKHVDKLNKILEKK